MNTHDALTTLAHQILRVTDILLDKAVLTITQDHAIPPTFTIQAAINTVVHLHRAQRNPNDDFNLDLNLHSAALEIQEAINTSPTTEIANALRSAYRVLDDIAATLDVNLE